MKSIIALLFIITVAYATEQCITSAGYSWCAFEGKCIRPWELAKEKNIEMTPENIESYCNGKKNIGTTDSNGCVSSAGYSWCAKVNKCVKPWELATENSVSIKTVQDFNRYCNNATVGADANAHGCAASEGYSWCKKENKCVQPWELAKLRNIAGSAASIGSYCSACPASAGYSYCLTENSCVKPWELTKLKNIENTPESFESYCSGVSSNAPKAIGGASGSHACLASAGYSWCQAEGKCVRPWELAREKNIENTPETVTSFCNKQIGGASDTNGCIAGAGYSFCARVNKCVQPWELALEQNIRDLTPESFNAWCAVSQ